MLNELAFVTFPSSFSTLLPSFLLHFFLRDFLFLLYPSFSLPAGVPGLKRCWM